MSAPTLVLKREPIRDHPDAVRVSVEGSIDPKTNNLFRDEMQKLLTAGTKRFFLDCAKLTYVNSSGLAFLLNISGTVQPKGGTVALIGVDPKILVIFKMMEITALFQFYPTYAEALRIIDEKLAAELRDVGPALKLDEPLKPVVLAPPKPARVAAAPSRTDRIARSSYRPPAPEPPGNPFVQFFRWLFGGGESRPNPFSRLKRTRR